ncbi:MAG: TatD family hydrolase, partial [Acidimicrobiales bacterium]
VPGPAQGVFEAWATVGLHPHDARTGLGEVEAVLERALTERPGVVTAVGECGLDYHYENSPRDIQREVFAEQVALARRHGLALVVHSRDAWDDTVDILSAEDAPEHIMLHCFTGGPDVARRCLDLGAYLSFSGVVTFKNAGDVRDALELCPLDRLLVETDAPFLAPVPHRGEQNKPAWVVVVGEAVAQIKAVPVVDIAVATTMAARAVFKVG